MAKYEIIVIIDGTLEAKAANEVNEKLLKLLDNTKDLKVTD
jgi:ribosomal protein S6